MYILGFFFSLFDWFGELFSPLLWTKFNVGYLKTLIWMDCFSVYSVNMSAFVLSDDFDRFWGCWWIWSIILSKFWSGFLSLKTFIWIYWSSIDNRNMFSSVLWGALLMILQESWSIRGFGIILLLFFYLSWVPSVFHLDYANVTFIFCFGFVDEFHNFGCVNWFGEFGLVLTGILIRTVAIVVQLSSLWLFC